MNDARSRTLLDFAIAASVAVVPIMLGMLLLVAVIRPQDPSAAFGPGQADRYVSVRHLAALKTFEQAVARRPATTSATPTAADVLAASSAVPSRLGGEMEHVGSAAFAARRHAGIHARSSRADRRATRRARRHAAALQHASQHPGRRCGRLRCHPLVRCRRQRTRRAVRSARVPGPALPRRMRRPRRRIDRIDPLGRPHAGGAGLARHRGRRGGGALAPRADDGGLGPRGGAPQPVERRGRMHLPRRTRSRQRAHALPRRPAQRAGAPVRAARDGRRIGGRRCAQARNARRRAAAGPAGRRRSLARAAVAAGDAAAARRPAPAVRRAVSAVHRCACRVGRAAHALTAMDRTASCSTAPRSMSDSRST